MDRRKFLQASLLAGSTTLPFETLASVPALPRIKQDTDLLDFITGLSEPTATSICEQFGYKTLVVKENGKWLARYWFKEGWIYLNVSEGKVVAADYDFIIVNGKAVHSLLSKQSRLHQQEAIMKMT